VHASAIKLFNLIKKYLPGLNNVMATDRKTDNYDIPTSNAYSKYFNTNQCFSYNCSIGTTLNALSTQPCSEVIIWNQTGQILYVYDQNRTSNDQRIAIPAAAAATPLRPYVIRGLTNADQVSAKTASSAGTVYWRTQFFSSNPIR
jgi:hypothetical protein